MILELVVKQWILRRAEVADIRIFVKVQYVLSKWSHISDFCYTIANDIKTDLSEATRGNRRKDGRQS